MMAKNGKTATIPQSVGRLVGLLAAVWVAWHPADVAASCGDYVIVGRPIGFTQTHDESMPVPERRPCRGPYCTGNPAGVPTTPAVTIPFTPDRWARVADPALPTPDSCAHLWLAEPTSLPFQVPTGIFHPPRPA